MKKKGLIISTVVMVVILIASLTTATYAWFSSAAEARVSKIGMTATAAEGILVGIRKDTTSTGLTRPDFVFGDVNWTASATTGKVNTDGGWAGTNGFGSLITPMVDSNALNLSVSKAMTKNDGAVADALFKKAEAGVNDQTPGAFEAAKANVDYIQLDLGLVASTHKTIDQIIGRIKVSPTDTYQIGMAAAVHFEIATKAPNGAWKTMSVIDAYEGLEAGIANFDSDDAASIDGTLNTDSNDMSWTYDFPIWKADAAADALSISGSLDVVEVKLLAWIEGNDPSCTTQFTGTGANIDLSFLYSSISTGDFEFADGTTAGKATQADPPKAVTFDDGEGTTQSVATIYGNAGDSITLPAAPNAKPGYTFNGWKKEGETTVLAAGSSYAITGTNDKFIADWTPA